MQIVIEGKKSSHCLSQISLWRMKVYSALLNCCHQSGFLTFLYLAFITLFQHLSLAQHEIMQFSTIAGKQHAVTNIITVERVLLGQMWLDHKLLITQLCSLLWPNNVIYNKLEKNETHSVHTDSKSHSRVMSLAEPHDSPKDSDQFLNILLFAINVINVELGVYPVPGPDLVPPSLCMLSLWGPPHYKSHSGWPHQFVYYKSISD